VTGKTAVFLHSRGSSRDTVINTLVVMLSACVGWLAWPGGYLIFALVMPALVFAATTRIYATFAAFAYYGVAAGGLSAVASVFFGADAPVGLGWMVWSAATAILTLPWTLLWSSAHAGYEWRIAAALAIATVPPVGIVGWASPITSAGILYPRWGWIGIVLTFVVMVSLARLSVRAMAIVRRPGGYLLLTVMFASLYLSVLANMAYIQPHVNGWVGMDTHWGPWPQDSSKQYRRHLIMIEAVIRRISAGGISVLVLPESSLGTWTPATEALWERAVAVARANGTTLVMGAEVPRMSGGYSNSLLVFERTGVRQLNARITAPISMWQPWTEAGAAQDWFGSGVADLAGHRIAYLICYEQLLVWPVLVSMAYQPKILVAAANDWWARETSIPELQRQAVSAWARLFGVPVVIAVNR